jgi:selenocysteine-specific elongation factor
VTPRGLYQTSHAVDVRLNYLLSAPRELKHRATLRLHSATYEVSAQVILIDRDTLRPGDSTHAQLRLAKPVLLLPGDPFVLRTYSPPATLGGGIIIDPFPPRMRRRSATAAELLHTLEAGDDTEKLRSLVASAQLSGLSLNGIVSRTGLTAKRAEAVLAPLLSAGELVQAVREPRVFISRGALTTLKETLLKELVEFRRIHQLKDGMGKEELKSRMPKRSDPRFFGALLTALVKERKVVIERELVKLPGEDNGLAANHVGLQVDIAAALQKGGAEPPTIKELCELLSCPEKTALDHLNHLARHGGAVKVKGDLFYAPAPFAEIRDKLVTHLKQTGEITPNEFRELTGLSRKFMIPLLEYFDSEKLTIRVGDKRILRKN